MLAVDLVANPGPHFGRAKFDDVLPPDGGAAIWGMQNTFSFLTGRAAKRGPFLLSALLSGGLALATPISSRFKRDQNLGASAGADLNAARPVAFRPQLVESAATDTVGDAKFGDGVRGVCVTRFARR